MIFKEIHIDGFGVFHNFSLPLGQTGVHVILGDNEAGKSTLLNFIRFTLFGYPRFTDQRLAPLNGGMHGGRIEALLAGGQQAIFERWGNDKIRLVYNNNESNNTSLWNQLLGNATADLFQNVYSFTLDELVGMSSLEKSGMEDKIFSLGLGLGNVSLSNVEAAIGQGADEIYKQRGKMQLVPNIMNDISAITSEIRLLQDNLPLYHSLNTQKQELERQIAENETHLAQYQHDKLSLEMNLKCYPAFVEYQQVKEQLSQLPPLSELPAKGKETLNILLQKGEELGNQQRAIQEGTDGSKSISWLEQSLEKLEVNQDILLQHERVEYIRANLASYRQAVKQRISDGNQLKELESAISQTIRTQIGEQWTEQAILDFSDITGCQNKAQGFENQLNALMAEKTRWEGTEAAILNQPGRLKWDRVASALALLIVLGSFLLFILGNYYLGAAVLVMGLALYFRRNDFKKTSPIHAVRKKLKEIEGQYAEIREDYRSWLVKTMKLSPDLSFHGVNDVLKSIAGLKKDLLHRDQLRNKIQQEWLPVIVDFEGTVLGLRDSLSTDHVPEETELLALHIMADHDQNLKIHQEVISLAQELENRGKALETVKTRSDENNIAIQKLLQATSVSSTDQFFELYATNEKIVELMEKKSRSLMKIDSVAGINRGLDVIEFLERTPKSDLDAQLVEKERLNAQLLAETNEMRTRMGSVLQQKERIEGDSDLALKLTRRGVLSENLNVIYRRWLTHKLALQMLAGVKENYEKERQPEVIQRAGEYFSKITSGRYAAIRTGLEGKELKVEAPRHQLLGINQLSRGTREQLLVSLRMGFIEEYEKQAEPLPVITDEILVNFDKGRAIESAVLINEFARNRQVLMFTCHPYVAEFLGAHNANVIRLAELRGNS